MYAEQKTLNWKIYLNRKFFYITSYLVPKWYYIINIPKE